MEKPPANAMAMLISRSLSNRRRCGIGARDAFGRGGGRSGGSASPSSKRDSEEAFFARARALDFVLAHALAVDGSRGEGSRRHILGLNRVKPGRSRRLREWARASMDK